MKKRIFAMVVMLLLIAGTSSAHAEWTYPVPLAALQTDYVRLANKESMLEDDYVPGDLVKVKVKKVSSTAIQMRQRVSDALDAMFAAATADGYTLYAKSGYRSYRTQRTMYYNRLERNNGRDDGVVAYPGASDHQTGLGIDVTNKAWSDKTLNAEFGETKEAIWMAENCATYGFIIRYPQGKEDITQIIYEPWHLRFVGEEAARYIMDSGLTLEEFTTEWQQALADFENGGGDTAAALAQEPTELNEPSVPDEPESTDMPSNTQPPEGGSEPKYGADGDLEISFFD